MRVLSLAAQQPVLFYGGTTFSRPSPDSTSFSFCVFSTVDLWNKPHRVQKVCAWEWELICLRPPVLTIQASLTSFSKGQYIMELLPLMIGCEQSVQFFIPL